MPESAVHLPTLDRTDESAILRQPCFMQVAPDQPRASFLDHGARTSRRPIACRIRLILTIRRKKTVG